MATNPSVHSIAHVFEEGTKLPLVMKHYDLQVIWCLDPTDPETNENANTLHGKRMAAGDRDRSKIVLGLSPDWPFPPLAGAAAAGNTNIRLCIVAHGQPVQEGAQYRVEIVVGQNASLQAKAFFETCLSKFLDKVPGGKVKRISLAMCYSAGVDSPDYKILPIDSFAQQLTDLCGDRTTDITGRRGVVRTSMDLVRGLDADFAQAKIMANPLFQVQAGDVRKSLINMLKETDGKQNYRTYIFRSKQPPQIKPDYTE